jgi:hypothetical protein
MSASEERCPQRKNGYHEGFYVIEVRFSELFFSIDLHQRKVAKNGMSALRSKRADRALKLLGALLVQKLRRDP